MVVDTSRFINFHKNWMANQTNIVSRNGLVELEHDSDKEF